MSRPRRSSEPLVSLTEKAARALRADVLDHALRPAHPGIQASHLAVFATLPSRGARAADMAARAGITRQSMGEVVRDLVALGLVESVADPDDGRAKVVRFTADGERLAALSLEHLRAFEERLRATVGDDAVDTAVDVLRRVRTMLAEPADAGGEAVDEPAAR